MIGPTRSHGLRGRASESPLSTPTVTRTSVNSVGPTQSVTDADREEERARLARQVRVPRRAGPAHKHNMILRRRRGGRILGRAGRAEGSWWKSRGSAPEIPDPMEIRHPPSLRIGSAMPMMMLDSDA